MTDHQWIKSLDKITDPREALRTIAENERFLGYDPYYRDIRIALISLAERVGNRRVKCPQPSR